MEAGGLIASSSPLGRRKVCSYWGSTSHGDLEDASSMPTRVTPVPWMRKDGDGEQPRMENVKMMDKLLSFGEFLGSIGEKDAQIIEQIEIYVEPV